MTLSVPASPTFPNVIDGASQQVVRATPFINTITTYHYVWARTGARIPGMYFTRAETTSTTYTQTNSATGSPGDLTEWFPTSQLLRKTNNAGADAIAIELQIFGADVECRLSLVELDTNTTATTLEVSQAGASTAWASGSTTLTWAESFEGDSTANPKRNFAYKLEFKALDTEATLLAWAVHEKYGVAAELPTP